MALTRILHAHFWSNLNSSFEWPCSWILVPVTNSMRTPTLQPVPESLPAPATTNVAPQPTSASMDKPSAVPSAGSNNKKKVRQNRKLHHLLLDKRLRAELQLRSHWINWSHSTIVWKIFFVGLQQQWDKLAPSQRQFLRKTFLAKIGQLKRSILIPTFNDTPWTSPLPWNLHKRPPLTHSWLRRESIGPVLKYLALDKIYFCSKSLVCTLAALTLTLLWPVIWFRETVFPMAQDSRDIIKRSAEFIGTLLNLTINSPETPIFCQLCAKLGGKLHKIHWHEWIVQLRVSSKQFWKS